MLVIRQRWQMLLIAGFALFASGWLSTRTLVAQEPVRRLTGTIVDTAGAPIALAQVTIEHTSISTRSDESGRFALDGVSIRRLQLRVRRIGYIPTLFDVDEASKSGGDVRIPLRAIGPVSVPVLDAVEVEAHEEVYRSRLEGFEKRSTSKVGHFITRARIEAHAGSRLSDLLREIPGVRVGRLEGLDHAVRIRGASCAPAVFIDGFPARASEFDLDMIDPETVEGVEVYSSASSVPNEFTGTGADLQCGVLLIWSRPVRARQAPPRRHNAPAAVRRDSSDESPPQ